MRYTVYQNTQAELEQALENLKINYEKRDASWVENWGTHKFDKRYQQNIIDYFKSKNKNIMFMSHSVWLK